ncbi:DUF4190 domain-containing protein [Rhodoglobus sp.]
MTSSTISDTSDSTVDSSAVVLSPSDEQGSSADSPAAGYAASADAAPQASGPSVAASSRPALSSTRTMSILALSLGIASFFFAQSVVVPLAAVILGVFGLRDEPSGRSFSVWGIVLACVATFGWVVLLAAGAVLSLPFLFLAAF